MFEAGLSALLLADPDVSTLIGTRLYPVQGPPANPDYPYVVFQDVTGSAEYAFDVEWDHRRIQFDLWGETYSQGKAIAQAFRNVLSGFAGTLSDGTRVIFATRLNYIDNFDVDQRTYRSIAEYEFEFSEV